MHEQKNLFLAIGLSIVIIIAFQFLFPQQTIMTPSSQQTSQQITEQAQQAPSTDEQQQVQNIIITKTKEEIIIADNRVLIDAVKPTCIELFKLCPSRSWTEKVLA